MKLDKKDKTLSKRIALLSLTGIMSLTGCQTSKKVSEVETHEHYISDEEYEKLLDTIEELKEQLLENESEEISEIETESEAEELSEIEELKKKYDLSNYVGTSLEEALKQNGHPSDFTFRKILAEKLGVEKYTAKEEEDAYVLELLGAKVIKKSVNLKDKSNNTNTKKEKEEEKESESLNTNQDKKPAGNNKPTNPSTPEKPTPDSPGHKCEYNTTYKYDSNKNGTHKVTKIETCQCGNVKTTLLLPNEKCTKGNPKRVGNYTYYYCTNCNDLLDKIEVKPEHTCDFKKTGNYQYKGNKTHSETLQCSCGKTQESAPVSCTPSTPKREGNYDCYYCTVCNGLLDKIEVKPEHTCDFKKTGNYQYKGNKTHSETLQCSCGKTQESAPVSCTPSTPKREGNYDCYYCTVCNGLLDKIEVKPEHTCDFRGTGTFQSNGNGTHSEILKCSCGETKVSVACLSCEKDDGTIVGDKKEFKCKVCGASLGSENVHTCANDHVERVECNVWNVCSCGKKLSIAREEHASTVSTTAPDAQFCSQILEYCERCGTELSKTQVPHSFVNIPIEDDPEYESKEVCSNCGYEKYNPYSLYNVTGEVFVKDICCLIDYLQNIHQTENPELVLSEEFVRKLVPKYPKIKPKYKC